MQHYDKDSYYNQLVQNNGYTPVYKTDEIKEEYCRQHNLKLIRIPYKENITFEYVQSFLRDVG